MCIEFTLIGRAPSSVPGRSRKTQTAYFAGDVKAKVTKQSNKVARCRASNDCAIFASLQNCILLTDQAHVERLVKFGGRFSSFYWDHSKSVSKSLCLCNYNGG